MLKTNRRWVLVGLVSLFFSLLTSLLGPQVAKGNTPSWITTDLNLELVKQLSSDSEIPSSMFGRGNRDCAPQSFTTTPNKSYPARIPQTEKKESVCAINTYFGTTNGKLLQRSGTSLAGKFDLPVSSSSSVAANLHSKTLVLLNPSASLYGSEVSLIYDASSKIKTKISPDGSLTHDLHDQTPYYPKTRGGANVSLGFETYSFSQNGKWLVADSPYEGHVRIDTESGDAKFFGTPFRYGNGIDPQPKTAISADGRYAVVGSHQMGYLRIYDLDDCDVSRENRDNISGCKSRNLRNLLNERLGGQHTYSHFRFINENKLSLYATGYFDGSSNLSVRKYTLSLVGTDKPRHEYIAMGDSFASGEGAFNYKVGTDTDDNVCHLSLDSFPYLIGGELNHNTYESVACSGGVIEDVISLNSKYGGQTLNKIDQSIRLEAVNFSLFTPGEVSQVNFKNEYLPKNITVSIGGNNVGFGDKLVACIANPEDFSTCFNTYSERKAVFEEIKAQIPELRTTYESLKKEESTVYVIAYPKIIKPGGECGLNVRLNQGETYFADSLTTVLNDAIETAAKQAGVFYVDTEEAFSGHRLCETENTNSAVHGLTKGDDRGVGSFKFLSAASYHPNILGHELYKDTILDKTSNFTAVNPVPDVNASLSEPAEDSEFYNVERNPTAQEVITPRLVDLSLGPTNLITREVSRQVNVSGQDNGLMPNSVFTIEIHSTPTALGTVQTDNDGNISASITIPSEIEPGLHSLHFYGETLSGEKIDLYGYVFVEADERDADGDGTNNDAEACVLVPASGVDFDGDGNDDACDGMIGARYIAPPTDDPEEDPVVDPTPTDPDTDTSNPSTPVIIPPMNNSQTSQSSQTGAGLQPQSAQMQNTTNTVQNSGEVRQDESGNSSNILNSGLAPSSLNVVSSPLDFSTTTTASPTPTTSYTAQTASSSGNTVLFAVLAVLFLVFAVVGFRKLAQDRA